MEKNILEGNKLISDFMGYDLREQYPFVYKTYGKDAAEKMLEYHSSWDWLMPACHKWDSLKDYADELKYVDLCDMLDSAVALYEIEPVWQQIVENIEWYNKEQKDERSVATESQSTDK